MHKKILLTLWSFILVACGGNDNPSTSKDIIKDNRDQLPKIFQVPDSHSSSKKDIPNFSSPLTLDESSESITFTMRDFSIKGATSLSTTRFGCYLNKGFLFTELRSTVFNKVDTSLHFSGTIGFFSNYSSIYMETSRNPFTTNNFLGCMLSTSKCHFIQASTSIKIDMETPSSSYFNSQLSLKQNGFSIKGIFEVYTSAKRNNDTKFSLKLEMEQ